MPGAGGVVDGRVLRGRRNRQAVVDAFLSLIEEGDPRPTARVIAARAGLSLRSVFKHFDDVEQIYEVAGRRHLHQLQPFLTPVDTSMPLDARLEEFLARRAELLVRLDPVARAARLREPFSLQLQANRESVVRLMEEQCAKTFAPELARVAPPSRDRLITALATATSWSTWYHLRSDQHLDERDATGVLGTLLSGLLGSRELSGEELRAGR